MRPAQVLYDAAAKEEAAARAERARLMLRTVIATYQGQPAAKAKTEIRAVYLFLEAEAQAREGKTRAAYISLRSVTTAYPESPLSRVAETRASALGPPLARD